VKNKGLLVAAGTVLGAVVLIKLTSKAFASQYVSFPASDFFQPDKVTYLADLLATEDEDEFILNAWNYVGLGITYEPIGSDINFDGETISCLYCWTVEQTLARGLGNCVCKSSVLASILLNRLAPERVHMVIGGFAIDGVGGHSWIEIDRNGTRYIVEATSPLAAGVSDVIRLPALRGFLSVGFRVRGQSLLRSGQRMRLRTKDSRATLRGGRTWLRTVYSWESPQLAERDWVTP
jgi:hypothetical protein